MGYSCIGLCRSWRSVACCGSSAVLPVFGSSALCGSVWRFKPFCCVLWSGIPSKCFWLYMVEIKPLIGVSGCGMLCSCSVFPVVPLCGVPGIIALSPFSVLRSVWLRGMVIGGKTVLAVIGHGWRLAAGGCGCLAFSSSTWCPAGDLVSSRSRRLLPVNKIQAKFFSDPLLKKSLVKSLSDNTHIRIHALAKC